MKKFIVYMFVCLFVVLGLKEYSERHASRVRTECSRGQVLVKIFVLF